MIIAEDLVKEENHKVDQHLTLDILQQEWEAAMANHM